mmetsp:Transcript_24592/g.56302  ORF Transcript_24592/g.56302 Transcript_24592/m.56302 type:complete len:363 (-) Transcript_24592:1485-2573(-)
MESILPVHLKWWNSKPSSSRSICYPCITMKKLDISQNRDINLNFDKNTKTVIQFIALQRPVSWMVVNKSSLLDFECNKKKIKIEKGGWNKELCEKFAKFERKRHPWKHIYKDASLLVRAEMMYMKRVLRESLKNLEQSLKGKSVGNIRLNSEEFSACHKESDLCYRMHKLSPNCVTPAPSDTTTKMTSSKSLIEAQVDHEMKISGLFHAKFWKSNGNKEEVVIAITKNSDHSNQSLLNLYSKRDADAAKKKGLSDMSSIQPVLKLSYSNIMGKMTKIGELLISFCACDRVAIEFSNSFESHLFQKVLKCSLDIYMHSKILKNCSEDFEKRGLEDPLQRICRNEFIAKFSRKPQYGLADYIKS